MKSGIEAETDQLIQVIRLRNVFSELHSGPLERRQLEERLGVSRATSHRYVRTLEDDGLIEKHDGRYQLSELGKDIASSVGTFEEQVGSRLRLGPMLESTKAVTPPLDIDTFVSATVTSADQGDPFAPLSRFISLVKSTESLRGINTCRIAPTYLEEFRDRILDGMETELIDLPEINRDIMNRYPEKCVQVCVSGNLTLWVHDVHNSLPFGLVLFDECIGLGLFEQSTGSLQQFIDTDHPDAREWARSVYDQYKSDSVYLENFTVSGLRNAIARF